MRDYAIVTLVFAWIPAILMFPFVGVYAWSWISYMVPQKLGFGFVFTWPLAEIVGIATLVAWLLSKEPKKLPLHPLVVMIIIFMIWSTVITITAIDPAFAYKKWDQTIKILLFTLVTCGLITTKNRLHALVWVIVVSLGFYGLKGGLFTITTGGQYHVWGPANSFIADNNQLALALVMLTPLIRYLQLQTPVRWIRWCLGGGIGLTIFAIFGTQSRGALLAIIAMLAFLILKSRRKAFALLASILAITVALVFMPQSWTDRMMTIQSYKQDSSSQERLTMWRFAIRLANDHPIVGGGFDAPGVPATAHKYLKPGEEALNYHSIYFETLGNEGYVGLAIFVTLLIMGFIYGGKVVRLTRNEPDLQWARDLGSMLQVSIVGYSVAGTFLNLATFDLYYHLIAMVAITDLLTRRALAQKHAPETEQRLVLSTTVTADPKPRFTV